MSFFGGQFGNFVLEFLTLFAGVFTVVIGVVFMAASIGILVVPYLLMMEEAKISDRRTNRGAIRHSRSGLLPG